MNYLPEGKQTIQNEIFSRFDWLRRASKEVIVIHLCAQFVYFHHFIIDL